VNLKSFLLTLFRGHAVKNELEDVRQAARDDARLVVETYVTEFEVQTSRILRSTQRRFLGLEGPDVIEGEVERPTNRRR
jgi:hypothetical protein